MASRKCRFQAESTHDHDARPEGNPELASRITAKRNNAKPTERGNPTHALEFTSREGDAVLRETGDRGQRLQLNGAGRL